MDKIIMTEDQYVIECQSELAKTSDTARIICIGTFY